MATVDVKTGASLIQGDTPELSDNNVFTGVQTFQGNAIFQANVGIGTTIPTSKLTINNNTAALPSVPVGTVLHIAQTENAICRAVIDSFSGASNLTFRAANGTAATPSALAANSPMGTLAWLGFGATGYTDTNRAAINGWAAQAWTDAAQGTYLTFHNTPIGSTITAEIMRIDSTGNIGIGTTTPSAKLHIDGKLKLTNSFNATNAAVVYKSDTDYLYLGAESGTTANGAAISLAGSTNTDTAAGAGSLTLHAVGASNGFVLKATTGNVGIGTTTPATKLHVEGDGYFLDKLGIGNLGAAALVIKPSTLLTPQTLGIIIQNSAGNTMHSVDNAGAGYFAGNVGIGTTAPTAVVHLKAGTAAANTAPLKLTSGTLNTTPEAGAIEFDGTNLYFVTSAGVRKTITAV